MKLKWFRDILQKVIHNDINRGAHTEATNTREYMTATHENIMAVFLCISNYGIDTFETRILSCLFDDDKHATHHAVKHVLDKGIWTGIIKIPVEKHSYLKSLVRNSSIDCSSSYELTSKDIRNMGIGKRASRVYQHMYEYVKNDERLDILHIQMCKAPTCATSTILIKDVTQEVMTQHTLKILVNYAIKSLAQYLPLCMLSETIFSKMTEGDSTLDDPYCLSPSNTSIQEDPLSVETTAIILFMDIVDFTELTETHAGPVLFQCIGDFYNRIDTCKKKYTNIKKIEIAGDSYVAAAGIKNGESEASSLDSSTTSSQHLDQSRMEMDSRDAVMMFAHDILNVVDSIRQEHFDIYVRIGINMGPVVSGIMGKWPPKFSIVGNPMVMAARLQSSALPNSIHATSHDVQENLGHHCQQNHFFKVIERTVYLKGKGMFNTTSLVKDNTVGLNNPLDT